MDFYKHSFSKLFDVSEIVTIHYFEYGTDFVFPGESHDFWEFLCVDTGEVTVTADSNTYLLKKGDIIFHQPNQFHAVTTNGIVAPNLVVISFVCHSPAMRFFENRIFSLKERERNLLATIIAEAPGAFSTPLNNPYTKGLDPASQQISGAEQMIQLSLEQFLISLYRSAFSDNTGNFLTKSIKLKQDEETFSHILAYMNTHICDSLTIDQICHDNLLSRSQLQKLFHDKCSSGIIDYFSRLKINYAKELIREKNMNFTQIADVLGYTSIHYFSRQFKKISGMSPSEYALSIKAISEK